MLKKQQSIPHVTYHYSMQVDIRAYRPIQFCPACSEVIGVPLAGSRDAICKNCGYKDPCCE